MKKGEADVDEDAENVALLDRAPQLAPDVEIALVECGGAGGTGEGKVLGDFVVFVAV